MAKRCTLSPIGVHYVDSDTSNKTYEVTIRTDGKNTCNCTGFVTKRNKLGGLVALGQPDCTCKHVKGVLASHGCGWTDDQDDAAPAQYPRICPQCSSPSEEYDPPAPAKIDDEMLNDAMAGLLALRERMTR